MDFGGFSQLPTAPLGLRWYKKTADPPAAADDVAARQAKLRNRAFVRAQKGLQRVDQRLGGRASLFRFHRVLGRGGFGVAAKYAALDQDGRCVEHVVVKAPVVKETEDEQAAVTEVFVEEWKFYTRLRGCQHIPELIEYRQPSVPASGQLRDPGNVNWWASECLILEFMEYGSLEDLIHKVVEASYSGPIQFGSGDDEAAAGSDTSQQREAAKKKPTKIPNRLLWRFFLCLTRAVSALAWPPLTSEQVEVEKIDRMVRRQWSVQGGRTKYPTVAEKSQPDKAPSGIVHFDTDPGNIFIGGGGMDPNDAEHEFHPILKLADFGLAADFDKTKEMPEGPFTMRGKQGYYAPEQFSEDLNQNIDYETYGVHTNIWGIGMIMFNLITRLYIPGAEIADGSYPHRDCRFQIDTRRDAPLTVRRTYGWPLSTSTSTSTSDQGQDQKQEDHFAEYDAPLRWLVARCLCHNPERRPSPADLERLILEAVASGDAREGRGENAAAETDAALREFVQVYFREPTATTNTTIPTEGEEQPPDLENWFDAPLSPRSSILMTIRPEDVTW